jgi:emfourin
MSSQAPALVEFHRSGGIAGFDDRLVIRTDGSAQLSRRQAAVDVTLAPDTLERLRTLLGEIPLERLRAEYVPPRSGADLFQYTVSFRGKSIRCVDTAIPPELQPLVQLLSGIASRR